MRTLISRHLLWVSVCGSVLAFLIARAHGGPLELVVLLASLGVFALGAALERLMPFRHEWNQPVGDTRTDLASAAVLLALVDPLLKALLPVLVVLAWPRAAPTPPAPEIGSERGFFTQVLAALLWLEAAKYASHRCHHRSRALWWLHALHHSSQRLYTLNNFRFYPLKQPLNHAINQLVSIGPLLMLGVPADVLLACLAITQPVLMLQHANVDLRSGWLNRVFSSNEVHRWHHSSRAAEANCNFGSALLLFDHLFGTYRAAGSGANTDPDANSAPATLGLFGDGANYPATQGYFRQLGSMFSPACCRR